jgi:hypothetical protein
MVVGGGGGGEGAGPEDSAPPHALLTLIEVKNKLLSTQRCFLDPFLLS